MNLAAYTEIINEIEKLEKEFENEETVERKIKIYFELEELFKRKHTTDPKIQKAYLGLKIFNNMKDNASVYECISYLMDMCDEHQIPGNYNINMRNPNYSVILRAIKTGVRE